MSFTRHRARRTGFRTWAKMGQPKDSPAVAEIKRLRALPGNCPEANRLIDEALRVQLEAEAKPKPSDGGVAGTMLLVGFLFIIVLVHTCT